MKKKQSWKDILLGLFSIVILIVISWYSISFFISSLTKADPKISATIIGGMFTIFAGLIAVIITQKQIKQRELEEAHRESKIEIYNKFIRFAINLIAAQNKASGIKQPEEKDLLTFMFDFKRDILLWGSPRVIRAQLKIEELAIAETADILLALNEMYLAMRDDIGLSNKGLNDNELIKLFLLDPTELDNALASNNTLDRTTALPGCRPITENVIPQRNNRGTKKTAS